MKKIRKKQNMSINVLFLFEVNDRMGMLLWTTEDEGEKNMKKKQ